MPVKHRMARDPSRQAQLYRRAENGFGQGSSPTCDPGRLPQAVLFTFLSARRNPRASQLSPANQLKERRMKLKIFYAAVAFAAAADPSMAKHLAASQGPAQSIFCATREAGNPYSKYCDYIAWSGWRRRGDWDSSLDNACWRNPRYVPPGCWPFSTPLPGGY